MIRALSNSVLVRIEKPERMTASKLLIIPDSAKREPYEMYQATVLACGPGERCTKGIRAGQINPMEVRVGERVLIYWSGLELPHYSQGDTAWVSERSIQGVLHD